MKSAARRNKRKNKDRANQRKKQRLTERFESVYKRTAAPWPTYLGNTMEENVAKAQIDVEAAACEINAHESPALVELLNNEIFSRQVWNFLTNCVPFVVQNRISTLMFSEIVDGDICKESGKNAEENCPSNSRSSSQDGENTCDEETSGEEAISDEENFTEEETSDEEENSD